MIWKIWVQCLSILIVMAMPLMAIQYFQQKESLHLMHDLSSFDGIESLIEKQMHRLQELATVKPTQENDYKQDFFSLLKLKKQVVETNQIQGSLIHTLEKQSLFNAGAVVALSLLLSLMFSWNIVRRFKKLLLEREIALKKELELDRLAQWQNTARCLVHELRGPLTPIKLITSTWEGEVAVLPMELLQEGVAVITAKVQLMENMINRFTVFAKLPTPELKAQKLSAVVLNFIGQYRDNFKAELIYTNAIKNEQLILADEGLLHNSFYAITKNAIEANPYKFLKIEFHLQNSSSKSSTNTTPSIALSIINNGECIPEAITHSLFEFGVSSKLPGSHNFGIGLAMTKKIAYEHQADIKLVKNNANEEISFQFLFPEVRNA